MKKIIFLICICMISGSGFAQDLGLFKNLNVKAGLTITYFHNFQGDYAYILQQNARVVEKAENKNGASLSFVVLIPFDKESKCNFLLNLPILDYKAVTTDSKDNSFFNSQTPFGVGFAIFPFEEAKFFGFTAMANIGRQKRMRSDAIDSQFFPIADYPNHELKVGAPVPESVLEPFTRKETSISANFGITIRF